MKASALHGASGRDRPLSAPALNLAGFDLNLMVAFEALMRERNVTQAAHRIGRSQSAMSHTLNRLRQMFDDRLFFRQGTRMIPSERAVELAALIEPAMAMLRQALSPRDHFDPQTSERQFVVGMNDATVQGLLPLFLWRLRQFAPGVQLTVVSLADEEGVDALQAGRIELAFDVYSELPGSVVREPLARVDFVGLADRANTIVRNGDVSLDDFLKAPHVRVAMNSQHTWSAFDQSLGLLGYRRHVACQTPFFSTVPDLIRGTDLVTVTGRHTIASIARPEDFAVFELPVEVPSLSCEMIWHPRSKADAGLCWLRGIVSDAVSGEIFGWRESGDGAGNSPSTMTMHRLHAWMTQSRLHALQGSAMHRPREEGQRK